MHVKAFISSLIFWLLTYEACFSQASCTQHWSKNNIQNLQLDSIISNLKLNDVDTIYCDSFSTSNQFNYKWYINFYNKQFGNYFSNTRSVNFAMIHFKKKNDSLSGELHIVQFVFDKKDIKLIIARFGIESKKAGNYGIEMSE